MRSRPILKAIALFTALTFICTQSVFAELPAVLNQARAHDEFSFPARPALDLPAELGAITEQNGNAPAVFLIQDAHGHEEAQRRTHEILNFLRQHHGLSSLLIEGGFGPLNPATLKFFREEPANRIAAEFLMREAEIGGAETFLQENPDVSSFGLEQPDFFILNIKAFQKVLAQHEETQAQLEASRGRLIRGAGRILPDSLRRFYKEWLRYEESEYRQLESFMEILRKESRGLGIDFSRPQTQLDWPMLMRLFEIRRREALIDQPAAVREAEKLAGWIRRIHAPEIFAAYLETRVIPDHSEEFVPGQPPRRLFWEMLHARLAPQGFRFENYPQLAMREGSRILQEELDLKPLERELDRLAEKVLAAAPEAPSLIRDTRRYLLARKLLSLKLTREEYQKLITEGDGRHQDRAIHTRQAVSAPAEYHPAASASSVPPHPNPLPQGEGGVRDVWQDALNFYRLALRRDRMLGREIVRRMKLPETGRAAVVAGGFHTDALTERLRRAGIEYAVITPRIREIGESEKKYEEALTGARPDFGVLESSVRQAGWLNAWHGRLPASVEARRRALRRGIAQWGSRKKFTPLAKSSVRSEVRTPEIRRALVKILDSQELAFAEVPKAVLDYFRGLETREEKAAALKFLARVFTSYKTPLLPRENAGRVLSSVLKELLKDERLSPLTGSDDLQLQILWPQINSVLEVLRRLKSGKRAKTSAEGIFVWWALEFLETAEDYASHKIQKQITDELKQLGQIFWLRDEETPWWEYEGQMEDLANLERSAKVYVREMNNMLRMIRENQRGEQTDLTLEQAWARAQDAFEKFGRLRLQILLLETLERDKMVQDNPRRHEIEDQFLSVRRLAGEMRAGFDAVRTALGGRPDIAWPQPTGKTMLLEGVIGGKIEEIQVREDERKIPNARTPTQILANQVLDLLAETDLHKRRAAAWAAIAMHMHTRAMKGDGEAKGLGIYDLRNLMRDHLYPEYEDAARIAGEARRALQVMTASDDKASTRQERDAEARRERARAVREAIKQEETKIYLQSEEFLSLPKSERLGALVHFILPGNPELKDGRMEEIHRAFPIELAPGVTGKDIEPVKAPVKTYLEIRDLIQGGELEAFFESKKYQALSPSQKLIALVEKTRRDRVPLEAVDLSEVYHSLPDQLSENLPKSALAPVYLSYPVFVEVRHGVENTTVQLFLESAEFRLLSPVEKLQALIGQFREQALEVPKNDPASVLAALPDQLSESVSKSDLALPEPVRVTWSHRIEAVKEFFIRLWKRFWKKIKNWFEGDPDREAQQRAWIAAEETRQILEDARKIYLQVHEWIEELRDLTGRKKHEVSEEDLYNIAPPVRSEVRSPSVRAALAQKYPLPRRQTLFADDVHYDRGYIASNEFDWFLGGMDDQPADVFIGFGNNAVWDLAMRRNAGTMILADKDREVLATQEYLFKPLFLLARTPAEFFHLLAATPAPDAVLQAPIGEDFKIIYESDRLKRLAFIRQTVERLRQYPQLNSRHRRFVSAYLMNRLDSRGEVTGQKQPDLYSIERLFEDRGDILPSFAERYFPAVLKKKGAEPRLVSHPFFSVFSSQAAFDRIKTLFERNQVFYVHGDMFDSAVYEAIGKFLKKNGRQASGLYLSNVADVVANNTKQADILTLQVLRDVLAHLPVEKTFTVYHTREAGPPHIYERFVVPSIDDLALARQGLDLSGDERVDDFQKVMRLLDITDVRVRPAQMKDDMILFFGEAGHAVVLRGLRPGDISIWIEDQKMLIPEREKFEKVIAKIRLILERLSGDSYEVRRFLKVYDRKKPADSEPKKSARSEVRSADPANLEFARQVRALDAARPEGYQVLHVIRGLLGYFSDKGWNEFSQIMKPISVSGELYETARADIQDEISRWEARMERELDGAPDVEIEGGGLPEDPFEAAAAEAYEQMQLMNPAILQEIAEMKNDQTLKSYLQELFGGIDENHLENEWLVKIIREELMARQQYLREQAGRLQTARAYHEFIFEKIGRAQTALAGESDPLTVDEANRILTDLVERGYAGPVRTFVSHAAVEGLLAEADIREIESMAGRSEVRNWELDALPEEDLLKLSGTGLERLLLPYHRAVEMDPPGGKNRRWRWAAVFISLPEPIGAAAILIGLITEKERKTGRIFKLIEAMQAEQEKKRLSARRQILGLLLDELLEENPKSRAVALTVLEFLKPRIKGLDLLLHDKLRNLDPYAVPGSEDLRKLALDPELFGGIPEMGTMPDNYYEQLYAGGARADGRKARSEMRDTVQLSRPGRNPNAKTAIEDILHYEFYEFYDKADRPADQKERWNQVRRALTEKISQAKAAMPDKAPLLEAVENRLKSKRWARFAGVVHTLQHVTQKGGQDDTLFFFAAQKQRTERRNKPMPPDAPKKEDHILFFAKEILEGLPLPLAVEFAFREVAAFDLEDAVLKDILPRIFPENYTAQARSKGQTLNDRMRAAAEHLSLPMPMVALLSTLQAMVHETLETQDSGGKITDDMRRVYLANVERELGALRGASRYLQKNFFDPLEAKQKLIYPVGQNEEGEILFQRAGTRIADVLAVLRGMGVLDAMIRGVILELRRNIYDSEFSDLTLGITQFRYYTSMFGRDDKGGPQLDVWSAEESDLLKAELIELGSSLEELWEIEKKNFQDALRTVGNLAASVIKNAVGNGPAEGFQPLREARSAVENLELISQMIRTGIVEFEGVADRIDADLETMRAEYETALALANRKLGRSEVRMQEAQLPAEQVREFAQFARVQMDEAIAMVEQARKAGFTASLKPDGSVVTEVDLAVQKNFLTALRKTYPGHYLWGEEDLKTPEAEENLKQRESADFVWAYDPIDGTRVFSEGSDQYGITLALYHKGLPVLGLLYSPSFGLMESSAASPEIYLNGQPLAPLDQTGLPAKLDVRVYSNSEHAEAVRQGIRTKAAAEGLQTGLIEEQVPSIVTTSAEINRRLLSLLVFIGEKYLDIWDIGAAAYLVTKWGGEYWAYSDQQWQPALEKISADLNGDRTAASKFHLVAGLPAVVKWVRPVLAGARGLARQKRSEVRVKKKSLAELKAEALAAMRRNNLGTRVPLDSDEIARQVILHLDELEPNAPFIWLERLPLRRTAEGEEQVFYWHENITEENQNTWPWVPLTQIQEQTAKEIAYERNPQLWTQHIKRKILKRAKEELGLDENQLNELLQPYAEDFKAADEKAGTKELFTRQLKVDRINRRIDFSLKMMDVTHLLNWLNRKDLWAGIETEFGMHWDHALTAYVLTVEAKIPARSEIRAPDIAPLLAQQLELPGEEVISTPALAVILWAVLSTAYFIYWYYNRWKPERDQNEKSAGIKKSGSRLQRSSRLSPPVQYQRKSIIEQMGKIIRQMLSGTTRISEWPSRILEMFRESRQQEEERELKAKNTETRRRQREERRIQREAEEAQRRAAQARQIETDRLQRGEAAREEAAARQRAAAQKPALPPVPAAKAEPEPVNGLDAAIAEFQRIFSAQIRPVSTAALRKTSRINVQAEIDKFELLTAQEIRRIAETGALNEAERRDFQTRIELGFLADPRRRMREHLDEVRADEDQKRARELKRILSQWALREFLPLMNRHEEKLKADAAAQPDQNPDGDAARQAFETAAESLLNSIRETHQLSGAETAPFTERIRQGGQEFRGKITVFLENLAQARRAAQQIQEAAQPAVEEFDRLVSDFQNRLKEIEMRSREPIEQASETAIGRFDVGSEEGGGLKTSAELAEIGAGVLAGYDTAAAEILREIKLERTAALEAVTADASAVIRTFEENIPVWEAQKAGYADPGPLLIERAIRDSRIKLNETREAALETVRGTTFDGGESLSVHLRGELEDEIEIVIRKREAEEQAESERLETELRQQAEREAERQKILEPLYARIRALRSTLVRQMQMGGAKNASSHPQVLAVIALINEGAMIAPEDKTTLRQELSALIAEVETESKTAKASQAKARRPVSLPRIAPVPSAEILPQTAAPSLPAGQRWIPETEVLARIDEIMKLREERKYAEAAQRFLELARTPRVVERYRLKAYSRASEAFNLAGNYDAAMQAAAEGLTLRPGHLNLEIQQLWVRLYRARAEYLAAPSEETLAPLRAVYEESKTLLLTNRSDLNLLRIVLGSEIYITENLRTFYQRIQTAEAEDFQGKKLGLIRAWHAEEGNRRRALKSEVRTDSAGTIHEQMIAPLIYPRMIIFEPATPLYHTAFRFETPITRPADEAERATASRFREGLQYLKQAAATSSELTEQIRHFERNITVLAVDLPTVLYHESRQPQPTQVIQLSLRRKAILFSRKALDRMPPEMIAYYLNVGQKLIREFETMLEYFDNEDMTHGLAEQAYEHIYSRLDQHIQDSSGWDEDLILGPQGRELPDKMAELTKDDLELRRIERARLKEQEALVVRNVRIVDQLIHRDPQWNEDMGYSDKQIVERSAELIRQIPFEVKKDSKESAQQTALVTLERTARSLLKRAFYHQSEGAHATANRYYEAAIRMLQAAQKLDFGGFHPLDIQMQILYFLIRMGNVDEFEKEFDRLLRIEYVPLLRRSAQMPNHELALSSWLQISVPDLLYKIIFYRRGASPARKKQIDRIMQKMESAYFENQRTRLHTEKKFEVDLTDIRHHELEDPYLVPVLESGDIFSFNWLWSEEGEDERNVRVEAFLHRGGFDRREAVGYFDFTLRRDKAGKWHGFSGGAFYPPLPGRPYLHGADLLSEVQAGYSGVSRKMFQLALRLASHSAETFHVDMPAEEQARLHLKFRTEKGSWPARNRFNFRRLKNHPVLEMDIRILKRGPAAEPIRRSEVRTTDWLQADDARRAAEVFNRVHPLQHFGSLVHDGRSHAAFSILHKYDAEKIIHDLKILRPGTEEYRLSLHALKFNMSMLAYVQVRDFYDALDPEQHVQLRHDLVDVLRSIQFEGLIRPKNGDELRNLNRRTWEGRTAVFNDFTDHVVQEAERRGKPVTIADVAVSDGTSALELAQRYQSRGVPVKIIGYDLTLGFTLINERDGDVHVLNDRGEWAQTIVRTSRAIILPGYDESVDKAMNNLAAWFNALTPDQRAEISGEWRIQHVSLINPEAEAFAAAYPDRLEFRHHNVFEPMAQEHDAVRVLGLLMRGSGAYFQDKKIKSALAALGRGLRPGGLLLNGTVFGPTMNQSYRDVFKRTGNRLIYQPEWMTGYAEAGGWQKLHLARAKKRSEVRIAAWQDSSAEARGAVVARMRELEKLHGGQQFGKILKAAVELIESSNPDVQMEGVRSIALLRGFDRRLNEAADNFTAELIVEPGRPQRVPSAILERAHWVVESLRERRQELQDFFSLNESRSEVRTAAGPRFNWKQPYSVRVRPDQSFDVLFVRDLFNPANPVLEQQIRGRKPFIILEEKQAPLLQKRIAAYPGIDPESLTVVSGTETAAALIDRIQLKADQQHHSRKDIFIVIGGARIQQIAAAAASRYHRGIPYIRIPTEPAARESRLLSPRAAFEKFGQAGFDGLIYPPQAILIDETLPGGNASGERERVGRILQQNMLEAAHPDDEWSVAPVPAGFHVNYLRKLDFQVEMQTDLFGVNDFALRRRIGPRRSFFVVDQSIGRGAIENIILSSGIPGERMLILPGGEEIKDGEAGPDNVELIHELARKAGVTRKDVFVLIGGGALLDVAGFAASRYDGGTAHIRIPTTLLAQIDAGIGVKNGINKFNQKNFEGVFQPAERILIDPALLATLDERTLRSGISEMVKVALMKDRGYFEMIEAGYPDLLNRNFNPGSRAFELMWGSVILHLEQIGTDPFETKLARPLDYGHEWGHRWERVTKEKFGNPVTHGEGVWFGSAIDTVISWRRGLLKSERDMERVLDLIDTLGWRNRKIKAIPTWDPRARHDDLEPGLESFRLHLGGELTISLLEEIGRKIDVHEFKRRRGKLEDLVFALDYLKKRAKKITAARSEVRSEMSEDRPDVKKLSDDELAEAILMARADLHIHDDLKKRSHRRSTLVLDALIPLVSVTPIAAVLLIRFLNARFNNPPWAFGAGISVIAAVPVLFLYSWFEGNRWIRNMDKTLQIRELLMALENEALTRNAARRSEVRLEITDSIGGAEIVRTKTDPIIQGFESLTFNLLGMYVAYFSLRNILMVGVTPSEVKEMLRRSPQAQITVADINLNQLERVQNAFKDDPQAAARLRLYRADASGLDPEVFPSGSFDFIFTFGLDRSAFFKDEDADRILPLMAKEFQRVLKAGGYLYHTNFSDADLYSPWTAKRELIAYENAPGIYRKPARSEVRSAASDEEDDRKFVDAIRNLHDGIEHLMNHGGPGDEAALFEYHHIFEQVMTAWLFIPKDDLARVPRLTLTPFRKQSRLADEDLDQYQREIMAIFDAMLQKARKETAEIYQSMYLFSIHLRKDPILSLRLLLDVLRRDPDAGGWQHGEFVTLLRKALLEREDSQVAIDDDGHFRLRSEVRQGLRTFAAADQQDPLRSEVRTAELTDEQKALVAEKIRVYRKSALESLERLILREAGREALVRKIVSVIGFLLKKAGMKWDRDSVLRVSRINRAWNKIYNFLFRFSWFRKWLLKKYGGDLTTERLEQTLNELFAPDSRGKILNQKLRHLESALMDGNTVQLSTMLNAVWSAGQDISQGYSESSGGGKWWHRIFQSSVYDRIWRKVYYDQKIIRIPVQHKHRLFKKKRMAEKAPGVFLELMRLQGGLAGFIADRYLLTEEDHHDIAPADARMFIAVLQGVFGLPSEAPARSEVRTEAERELRRDIAFARALSALMDSFIEKRTAEIIVPNYTLLKDLQVVLRDLASVAPSLDPEPRVSWIFDGSRKTVSLAEAVRLLADVEFEDTETLTELLPPMLAFDASGSQPVNPDFVRLLRTQLFESYPDIRFDPINGTLYLHRERLDILEELPETTLPEEWVRQITGKDLPPNAPPPNFIKNMINMAEEGIAAAEAIARVIETLVQKTVSEKSDTLELIPSQLKKEAALARIRPHHYRLAIRLFNKNSSLPYRLMRFKSDPRFFYRIVPRRSEVRTAQEDEEWEKVLQRRALIPGGIQMPPAWADREDYQFFAATPSARAHDIKIGRVFETLERISAERGISLPEQIKDGRGLVLGFGKSPDELTALKERYGLSFVHGIDWVAEDVYGAADYLIENQQSADHFRLHHSDFENLEEDIPSESVNIVLMHGATLWDPSDQTARQIARMLVPGGIALLANSSDTDFRNELEKSGDVFAQDNYFLIFRKRRSEVRMADGPALWVRKDGKLHVGNNRWVKYPAKEPVYQFTRVLQKGLQRSGLLRPDAEILDVGSGEGIILIGAADQVKRATGVEIYAPDAEASRKAIAENGLANVEIYEGDMFEPVQGRRFDVITGNLPQLPTGPVTRLLMQRMLRNADDLIFSNDGGENGRQVIEKFLREAPKHLKPGGKILMTHAHYIHLKKTEEFLKSLGLEYRVIHKEKVTLTEDQTNYVVNFLLDDARKVHPHPYWFKDGRASFEIFVLEISVPDARSEVRSTVTDPAPAAAPGLKYFRVKRPFGFTRFAKTVQSYSLEQKGVRLLKNQILEWLTHQPVLDFGPDYKATYVRWLRLQGSNSAIAISPAIRYFAPYVALQSWAEAWPVLPGSQRVIFSYLVSPEFVLEKALHKNGAVDYRHVLGQIRESLAEKGLAWLDEQAFDAARLEEAVKSAGLHVLRLGNYILLAHQPVDSVLDAMITEISRDYAAAGALSAVARPELRDNEIALQIFNPVRKKEVSKGENLRRRPVMKASRQEKRSEVRLVALSEKRIASMRETADRMTARITFRWAWLFPEALAAEAGSAASGWENSAAAELTALLRLGGSAVIPAQFFGALSLPAREKYLQWTGTAVSDQSQIYFSGTQAVKLQEEVSGLAVMRAHRSGRVEFKAHDAAVLAARLEPRPVAASLTSQAAAEAEWNFAVPVFSVSAEEMARLSENDQLRYLVRLTELQLIAAVELKEQLREAAPAAAQQILSRFLDRAGIAHEMDPGGFVRPTAAGLLSESLTRFIETYQATASAA